VEIIKHLCGEDRRKRHGILSNDWILHCDNAPAHKALSNSTWLAQKLITENDSDNITTCQKPYSYIIEARDLWIRISYC
jgi:hypothetical protein